MKRRDVLFALGLPGILAPSVRAAGQRSDVMKREIKTDKAPRAIGPYSQAIAANGFVFVSGQIPLDPATGELVGGPIADQARRVLTNVGAVLEAAGTSFDKVVKASVFLQDMNDFAGMNAVYGEFFKAPFPARAAVQVARLPKDVRIEVEVIALEK